MKRLLFVLIGISFFVNVRANVFENASLHGKIVGQDKKPMEFVVVTLLKASDSSLVKGCITDADGNFSFDNLDTGNFLVQASFTGFSKLMEGPFILVANQNLVVDDLILLPAKSEEEVTISAAQPLYTQKADKLIMNVENSPVRLIGTAWDLLTTAPGVVTDQNGKITLRGKSGVLVYIDNKNTFLGGDQLMNYLQNISAADIVSIEIISNPSAKYDAQGSGGILNFITKKGSQLGFNGSVRAGVGQAFYTKYDGGANFNYATAKYNLYGKYDFGNRNYLERAYINRNVSYNNITTNFNQHNSTIGKPFGQTAQLGVDFYAKHDLTWGFRFEGSRAIDNSKSINSTFISQDGNDADQLYQKNGNNSLFENATANLYFDQKLDTNGKEFSGSIDYLNYNTNDKQTFNLNYYDHAGNVSAPSEDQRSGALSDINILVGQLDYAHPFGKKYKLEAGVKSSYVKTDNDLTFDNLVNNNWENDSTKSNRFIYTEQISAMYVTGYATLGSWELEAGLRGEQTLSDGNSPTTKEELKNGYFQLFPSVFILEKLNDKMSLNYTYARRVNRPGYEDLNPFVFYLDKYTYEKGNPFLQPEISNNVDATFSFMDALFVTAGYGRTEHAMTAVTNQVDSTGVGYKTTVNLHHVDAGYFGISTPIPIANWFMAEVELSEGYGRYTSNLFGTDIDIKTWRFNASTTLTFTFPHNFKLQAWGWYQGPGIDGIFVSKSLGGVGTSLSKTFFSNQLSVNLVGNDLFKTNGMRAKINFQGQDVYLQFIPESPRVTIRVRYSFGNKKATRKTDGKSGADELKDRTGK